MWSYLSRQLLLVFIKEAAPGLFQCRACPALIDTSVASALTHLAREHPRTYQLLIVGVVGVSLAAAFGPASTRRRR